MKILVGYDGSNAAMDALKLAIRHAKAFQAQVVVVTSLKGEDKESRRFCHRYQVRFGSTDSRWNPFEVMSHFPSIKCQVR